MGGHTRLDNIHNLCDDDDFMSVLSVTVHLLFVLVFLFVCFCVFLVHVMLLKKTTTNVYSALTVLFPFSLFRLAFFNYLLILT